MSRLLNSLILLLPMLAACGPAEQTTPEQPAPTATSEASLVTSRPTLRFLSNWAEEQSGAIVRGGQLVVEYELNRLTNCQGSTTYGQPDWGTTAYVRFQPGGQTFSGPVVQHENLWQSPTSKAIPFEVTVPTNATSAELWFVQQGNGCGPVYDSDYGANYRFAVEAQAPAGVVWAGDWGGSFSRECVHQNGLPNPIVIDSYVRERACKFVDADVYVPGLTDGATERPQYVYAQAEYSVDGGPMQYAWLSYQGRVGNNYRYRWQLPYEVTFSNWNAYAFAFRYSTDGVNWFRIGLANGPTGGTARTIQRAF
jgi:hypothetical protein